MKTVPTPPAHPVDTPRRSHRLEEFWAGAQPQEKRVRAPLKDLTTRSGRVILAEDDDELRGLLAAALRRDGHDVIEMRDGYALLDEVADVMQRRGSLRELDVIVSDIRLPGLTGLHALAEIRTIRGAPPVILITGFGDEKTHRAAASLGAFALLDKPFDVDDLRTEVARILSH